MPLPVSQKRIDDEEKECSRCHVWKNKKDCFSACRGKGDGFQPKCKSCNREQNKEAMKRKKEDKENNVERVVKPRSTRVEHVVIGGEECKQCSKCEKYLPTSAFAASSNWDGLHHGCRECMKQDYKERGSQPPSKKREATPDHVLIDGKESKWCEGCEVYHPVEEFYSNVLKWDGRDSYCKEVHKQRKAIAII